MHPTDRPDLPTSGGAVPAIPARDAVRVVDVVPLHRRGRRTTLAVDGDVLEVAVPRWLSTPLRLPAAGCRVAVLPTDAVEVPNDGRWFRPGPGGRTSVVLALDAPVALPPLARWAELDTGLPFARVDTQVGAARVDGLVLGSDRGAAELVAELRAAGVRVDPAPPAGGSSGGHHEVPFVDAVTVVLLHLAAALALVALWPPEDASAADWVLALGLVLAAFVAPPVLARGRAGGRRSRGEPEVSHPVEP